MANMPAESEVTYTKTCKNDANQVCRQNFTSRYIRDEQCSTHTCFKFRIDKGSMQVAYNSKYVALRNQCRLFPRSSKMSIEAAWAVKLLWMILMLAMFTKTFLSFEKSHSVIS